MAKVVKKNWKKDNQYYEPNDAPDEVKLAEKSRVIKVRFRNIQDVNEFTRLTGIPLQPGKVNRVKLPIGNSLINFI